MFVETRTYQAIGSHQQHAHDEVGAFWQNWRPCVCGNADLPGRLVAINSMHVMKLERFGKIGECSKRNFENEFLVMFCQILQEIIFLMKLEHRILENLQ